MSPQSAEGCFVSGVDIIYMTEDSKTPSQQDQPEVVKNDDRRDRFADNVPLLYTMEDLTQDLQDFQEPCLPAQKQSRMAACSAWNGAAVRTRRYSSHSSYEP